MPFDALIPQPTLIFQGLRDASVDYRTVEEFARTRPNVTLSLLDDDHQLMASLPRDLGRRLGVSGARAMSRPFRMSVPSPSVWSACPRARAA